MSVQTYDILIVTIFASTFTGLGIMLGRVWWGWR